MMFFASADEEFVIFIDRKNNLEIIARQISTDTNFNGKEIENEKDLLEFADSAGFPSHGLILRKSKTDCNDITKGITSMPELLSAFHRLYQKYKRLYVETDMRAMYNPSRMKVIESVARKLVDKINSCCPECKTPGFGITEARKGLACELCGLPTQSTLSYIYQCQKCNFKEEVMYPHQKTSEDPMYCDFCNP
jgi:hypothetical protein